MSLEVTEQTFGPSWGVCFVARGVRSTACTFLAGCLSRGFVSGALGRADVRRHPATCVHVFHPALEVVDILEGLNDPKDARGGACGDESVGGSLAFGPALLLGPNVAASLGESEVFQASNPGIPMAKFHSSGVFSAHAKDVCPDSGIVQHPESLIQNRVKS